MINRLLYGDTSQWRLTEVDLSGLFKFLEWLEIYLASDTLEGE